MRILLLAIAGFLTACSPVSKRQLSRTIQETEKSFQDHMGFVLYDPAKRKTVFAYNSDKYFIPASNTKIVTFYTSLVLLKDSIPGIIYGRLGDSLIIRGTGDPSLLYDQVNGSNRVFNFLKEQSGQLYFVSDNFQTTALGPGWAWDDYNYAYSAERSALPVYGNTFRVQSTPDQALSVSPRYFRNQLSIGDSLNRSSIVRELNSNRTAYYPGQKALGSRTWRVPFRTDSGSVGNLLADTLGRSVYTINAFPAGVQKQVLCSVPADSLYKVMMQDSDNLIAEQLLLICAGLLSDTLQPEIAIRYMQANQLRDLPDPLVWVDGSGLSRYNLFTPRSIVRLWEKIDGMVERDRLFALLATGGKSGTLQNFYTNNKPYIYGKTGTLSNVHTLSGFLLTKKGETLIFSLMSNNFTVPVRELRAHMETVLKQIHENY